MRRNKFVNLVRRQRGLGLPHQLLSVGIALVLVGASILVTWNPGSAPVKASAAGSIPNLTPSTSGIHLGLMFNWQVNTAPGETKGAEVGVDNFVFGAEESSENANIPATSVHHQGYYPLGRDLNRTPNEITTMKTTHPDWIVYTTDRQTPAWYNSEDQSNGYQVPIDISNLAVQAYMMSSVIAPKITTYGYAGIGFDQGETLNYTHRAGVYRTATSLSSPASRGDSKLITRASIAAQSSIAVGNGTNMEYVRVASAAMTRGAFVLTLSQPLAQNHAAGEWVGTWTQQYDGNILDAAYRSATIQAFQQIVQRVRSTNPSATISINDSLNMWNSGTDQNGAHAWDYWRDLVPYVDIVVDECGFTNCGDSPYYDTDVTAWNGLPNPWLTTQQDLQWAEAQGKGVLLDGYEPYQVTSNMTVANAQARADLQWNLANYLLLQGSYTYLAWRGAAQTDGEVYKEPEYSAPIGSPTGSPFQSQGVWMRDFSTGRSVVNPSSASSVTISLLPNTYTDLYGNAVTTYTVPAHSGLVLLARGAAGTSPASSGAPTPASTATPSSTSMPASTAVPTATSIPTSTPMPTSTPIPTSPRAASTSPPAALPWSSPPPGGRPRPSP